VGSIYAWFIGWFVGVAAFGGINDRTASGMVGCSWQRMTTDHSKGPFSSENFLLSATVVFSFLFDKNCLIIDYLGLKDSSHDFSANCVISFFFVYI